MKITKEQFDKLYSDNISKKEYDEIINLVDKRFGEVVILVYPKITNGRGWFVYGNYNYNSENDEGYFDLEQYKTEIEVGGEYTKFPEPYCFCDNGWGYIPTRWLWTDDKEILKEFNKEVEKCKNEKVKEKELLKQKREELKNKKAKFREIIESKLTKEELKYILFK